VLETKYAKVPLAERISSCTASKGAMAWVQLGEDPPIFYKTQ
jgi:hypothetical protein